MDQPYRHCPYCGRLYEQQSWPLQCGSCGKKVYRNPLPVVVVLLPILDQNGLLAVRRAIEPGKGKLALPGGYIDWKDTTWQMAAVREMREETSIRISAAKLTEFRVLSTPDHRLVVFALSKAIDSSGLPAFQQNNEISELVILQRARRLAFSTHTAVVKQYFKTIKSEPEA